MAFSNLCTVADVKGELALGTADTPLDDPITNRIPVATIQVYQDAELSIPPTEDMGVFNAKMACVYKVLEWLEERGLIEPLEDKASSIKDGDFQVNFAMAVEESDSYTKQYTSYINKLRPSFPVGSNPYI